MAAPSPVPTVEDMSNSTITPAITRGFAVAGLVGALLQILGGILETVDRVNSGEPGFVFRTSIIAIAYLALMIATIGLARSGSTGHGLPARLGLGAAAVGWLLSAVAQFVLQTKVELAERVLFPIAMILIGLGMLTYGIAVLRNRSWQGWPRFIPLVCGLFPFLVIFPVFAATGGPNFLVLSAWGICWLALSLGLWTNVGVNGT
jgi:hypothetical protein